MSLTRTVQPLIEPVTLAEALAHLREDAGAADAYITSLITVARADCESRIERTLITSTWVVKLTTFPSFSYQYLQENYSRKVDDLIHLPRPNILSVVSVAYVDLNGATQTLTAGTDYQVNLEDAAIAPAFSKSWPAARDQFNSVTVTYTAGYGTAASDVPAPIKQWILLAVADMYAHRNRSGEAFSTKGGGGKAVPQDFAEGLLDPYRIYQAV